MNQTEIKETTRLLKRRFFAMRNGAIADQMRRAGASYRINFGLNLPQITEIAREMPMDVDFAESLRGNVTTRESMLIAPMLYPLEKMDVATALRWIHEVTSVEVADVLCHKLLRRLPFAAELPASILGDDSVTDLSRYCALRLMHNCLNEDNAKAFGTLAHNEAEAGRPTTYATARMLEVRIGDMLEPDEDVDDSL